MGPATTGSKSLCVRYHCINQLRSQLFGPSCTPSICPSTVHLFPIAFASVQHKRFKALQQRSTFEGKDVSISLTPSFGLSGGGFDLVLCPVSSSSTYHTRKTRPLRGRNPKVSTLSQLNLSSASKRRNVARR